MNDTETAADDAPSRSYNYMTATYDPADNKLRLSCLRRLDEATYKRVKDAGFIWAPKQQVFVAPMWTPGREDLLLGLCGEIGDEDTSLVDRAEQRAERFEDYGESRLADAKAARSAVDRISDGIPLGQPILVGHHSEKHARKDAERIENGMRKAVQMWDTANYWKQRAAGAIRHAKYKERPDVRARRIKGLEADKRKQEKYRDEAAMWLKLWNDCANEPDKELQRAVALRIAGACWLHLPRKEGDKPDFNQCPTADTALTNAYPNLYAPRTLEEVLEVAKTTYPRQIAHAERWINHLNNRLEYERAMLGEAGGTVADQTKPEKGGACRCWASPFHRMGWSYIQKVNKISVTVLDNWGNGGGNFTRTIEFDKLKALMTKAEVDAAREAGRIMEDDSKTGFVLKDAPVPECKPREPKPETEFDAMRETLKAGIQVVSAPQLFPTPPEIAAAMVALAEIEPDHRVLEPSAGTGNILRAIGDGPDKVAVEINAALVQRLAVCGVSGLKVVQADFLECNGELGQFDRIIMNPPFAPSAADIKHIKHAFDMLKPGGRLVAICANGPRQQAELKPLVEECGGMWKPLPADTFKSEGTGVNTVLLSLER